MTASNAKHRRLCLAALWVVAFWAASPPGSFADEAPAARPPRYAAAGAPADPKVVARWNRYHDHAQATELLQQLAAAHPDRAQLQSLGKSYGDRDMWVMTITNQATGKDTEKPAFWIDGGIHANEIQSVEVVLYTAWYLLEMYEHNAYIKRLLDERTFYLMPMMSPDSRDEHLHNPNSTHTPRTGQRPVDDDRDGLIDEDGPDDLDGDGHITQMRVRDPNGRYKPHPDYPELLIRAKPDEKGEYRLLGVEGFDNDGDGRVNEDGDGSYDPNRDWPWQWQPRAIQDGAYRYPFSVLENRMVADFIMAHPNIAGAQSYHNAGGMILRGPGVRSDSYDAADVRVFDALAKRGEEMLPGYRYLVTAIGLYEVFGGEDDWLYYMQGIVAFTNELWTPFNLHRKPSEGGYFGNMEDVYRFNRDLLFEGGVVPWREVDHPQYGKIEVGGLKKNWLRQPPSFLLEEECHRNMAFTLYHADQMPQARVAEVTTRPLAEGLTEVTARIVNDKLIPTRAAIDVRNKLTRPDRVTIEGPNAKVLAALISDEPFFNRPREQKLRPHELRIDSVPSLGAIYCRWIVAGEGPYTVAIDSVKGGTHRASSVAE